MRRSDRFARIGSVARTSSLSCLSNLAALDNSNFEFQTCCGERPRGIQKRAASSCTRGDHLAGLLFLSHERARHQSHHAEPAYAGASRARATMRTPRGCSCALQNAPPCESCVNAGAYTKLRRVLTCANMCSPRCAEADRTRRTPSRRGSRPTLDRGGAQRRRLSPVQFATRSPRHAELGREQHAHRQRAAGPGGVRHPQVDPAAQAPARVACRPSTATRPARAQPQPHAHQSCSYQ